MLIGTATASDYQITWSNISNGGSASHSNDLYSVAGTIGQYASGQTGASNDYSISGGFWPGIGGPPGCLADFNNDGQLDFFDVSEFLLGFISMEPVSDLNGDGLFNFFDVSIFLVAYKDGCP